MNIRTLGIRVVCWLSVAAVCHAADSPLGSNARPGTEDPPSALNTAQAGTLSAANEAQTPVTLPVSQEDDKLALPVSQEDDKPEAARSASPLGEADSISAEQEAPPPSQEDDKRPEVASHTGGHCEGLQDGEGQCDDPREQHTDSGRKESVRASDEGFLSAVGRPMRTNYELALEQMLSSLMQFFPYPVVYIPVSASRFENRGSASRESNSASTELPERSGDAPEQADSLSADIKRRSGPKDRSTSPPSSPKQPPESDAPRTSPPLSPKDPPESDAPRPPTDKIKRCKSCSRAGYYASPYDDYYPPFYYGPYDYYGYDPYEVLPRQADYRDPYYRSRNNVGGRYLGEFPDLHIGDTAGLHLRPARHQYEHRQYGSHYSHGMDRFFY